MRPSELFYDMADQQAGFERDGRDHGSPFTFTAKRAPVLADAAHSGRNTVRSQKQRDRKKFKERIEQELLEEQRKVEEQLLQQRTLLDPPQPSPAPSVPPPLPPPTIEPPESDHPDPPSQYPPEPPPPPPPPSQLSEHPHHAEDSTLLRQDPQLEETSAPVAQHAEGAPATKLDVLMRKQQELAAEVEAKKKELESDKKKSQSVGRRGSGANKPDMQSRQGSTVATEKKEKDTSRVSVMPCMRAKKEPNIRTRSHTSVKPQALQPHYEGAKMPFGTLQYDKSSKQAFESSGNVQNSPQVSSAAPPVPVPSPVRVPVPTPTPAPAPAPAITMRTENEETKLPQATTAAQTFVAKAPLPLPVSRQQSVGLQYPLTSISPPPPSRGDPPREVSYDPLCYEVQCEYSPQPWCTQEQVRRQPLVQTIQLMPQRSTQKHKREREQAHTPRRSHMQPQLVKQSYAKPVVSEQPQHVMLAPHPYHEAYHEAHPRHVAPPYHEAHPHDAPPSHPYEAHAIHSQQPRGPLTPAPPLEPQGKPTQPLTQQLASHNPHPHHAPSGYSQPPHRVRGQHALSTHEEVAHLPSYSEVQPKMHWPGGVLPWDKNECRSCHRPPVCNTCTDWRPLATAVVEAVETRLRVATDYPSRPPPAALAASAGLQHLHGSQRFLTPLPPPPNPGTRFVP